MRYTGRFSTLLLISLALGCTTQETSIHLVVDSSLSIPDEIDGLRLQLNNGQVFLDQTYDLGAGGLDSFPLDLIIVRGEAAPGEVSAQVDGLLGTTLVAQAQGTTSFVEGTQVELALRLGVVTPDGGEDGGVDGGDEVQGDLSQQDWGEDTMVPDISPWEDRTQEDVREGDLPPGEDGCEPALEECDGLDNDCDGLVDEEVEAPVCPLAEGVCQGAVAVCGGELGWLPCGAEAYGEAYEEEEGACDGLDNDCDGLVDEDLEAPLCSKQAGVCEGAVKVCGGVEGWLACGDEVYLAHHDGYAKVESSCDGLDNDCDGDVDEVAIIPPCANQVGVCRGAVSRCAGAEGWVCGPEEYGEAYEAVEVSCDGLDNDCDGEADGFCVFVRASGTCGDPLGTYDCPYATIQEGLDLADSEKVVMVLSGEYFEDAVATTPVEIRGEGKGSTLYGTLTLARGVRVRRLEFKCNGGGVGLEGRGLSQVEVEGNVFSGCEVAMDLQGSSEVLVRNNLATQSTSAGIDVTDGVEVRVINNTLVGLAAAGCGVAARGADDIVVENNIVKTMKTGICLSGAVNAVWNYNDLFDCNFGAYDEKLPSEGDLEVDPALNADYSLSEGSPCRDAGDPDPVYNDADGTRNDMGATGGSTPLTF